jgi:sugar O-acyltransferase (sialic acid O-acetyltransferase NeuD family)
MKKVVIIGAGGHAKVLAETIDLIRDLELVGFIDDQIEKGTLLMGHVQVIGSINDIETISGQCDAFVMGIGNNEIRKQLLDQYSGKMDFETIIHPLSFISGTADIGTGTVVLAGAIIHTNAKVGSCCIINSNVVVDHDCEVGDFTHLAIGTLVGSNSKIGSLLKTDVGQAIPAFSVIG